MTKSIFNFSTFARSEFGLPAMPDIRTIDHWLDGNVKDRYAQSKSMMQHNKAGAHERRFAVLMNESFRLTSDLERFVRIPELSARRSFAC